MYEYVQVSNGSWRNIYLSYAYKTAFYFLIDHSFAIRAFPELYIILQKAQTDLA